MQKKDLTRSDLRSFSRASRIRVLDASEWQAKDQVTVTVEADVATNMLFTTHSLPISFLLKELKSCCGSVVFLGIQPPQLEFMSPLTPAMHEAVEKIYGMLKAGSNFTRERFVKKKCVAAMKPDALSPAETETKTEGIGVTKAAMSTGKCFVSAMLAGAFIAFGGMYFCVFLGDPTIPFAAQRMVGGICFCLGLVLVLCCGAELFTGNSLMCCAKASNKIGWAGMLKNWVIVWFGNLAGALVAVALIYFAQVYAMNGGAVGQAMVSVAASKVSPDWFTLFAKGIMCNILVCLAVWIGFAGRTVTDKVIGIILPISAFVACGFEHCVANMFFLPTGLLLNSMGIGAEGAITMGGILFNLSAATLGNIVGGVLVGMAYWYIYAKRAK